MPTSIDISFCCCILKKKKMPASGFVEPIKGEWWGVLLERPGRGAFIGGRDTCRPAGGLEHQKVGLGLGVSTTAKNRLLLHGLPQPSLECPHRGRKRGQKYSPKGRKQGISVWASLSTPGATNRTSNNVGEERPGRRTQQWVLFSTPYKPEISIPPHRRRGDPNND